MAKSWVAESWGREQGAKLQRGVLFAWLGSFLQWRTVRLLLATYLHGHGFVGAFHTSPPGVQKALNAVQANNGGEIKLEARTNGTNGSPAGAIVRILWGHFPLRDWSGSGVPVWRSPDFPSGQGFTRVRSRPGNQESAKPQSALHSVELGGRRGGKSGGKPHALQTLARRRWRGGSYRWSGLRSQSPKILENG